ncbi:flagellar protein FliO/FliZ [Chromohalobacter marismortui]|uniref:Flagellar protein n=1 Tax=Chromohalobacter marismortui TaxID=42055 RepID=A0A4R7NPH2_9GAMM|nr:MULTISPECIES: flagellar biosynthetic protein FliO [Chromohalobacter]MCI0508853.1 flagellar biosynthetic protein FliO [Chromohalobacter sp.]MCI0594290.1 flagellar biosynthetic protein FliO [Chromohalobacter sp.]TDU22773.1 flagellar protein FliO/FliZ [Chromohalobacter marismortui]
MSVADSAREAAVSLDGSGDAALGMAWVGKATLSLALIVAIILLCAWLLRRLTPGRLRASQHVKVISNTAVGQRERVTIVEIDGRWLVLGVGGNQVNLLKDMPAADRSDAPTSAAPAPLSGSFSQRFRQALAQNIGRKPPSHTTSRSQGAADEESDR